MTMMMMGKRVMEMTAAASMAVGGAAGLALGERLVRRAGVAGAALTPMGASMMMSLTARVAVVEVAGAAALVEAQPDLAAALAGRQQPRVHAVVVVVPPGQLQAGASAARRRRLSQGDGADGE